MDYNLLTHLRIIILSPGDCNPKIYSHVVSDGVGIVIKIVHLLDFQLRKNGSQNTLYSFVIEDGTYLNCNIKEK